MAAITTNEAAQFPGTGGQGIQDGEPGTGQTLTTFLDRHLPLADASHCDAIAYTVEIPTRYARFLARLTDGRTVGLARVRQFLGWTGYGEAKSTLFDCDGKWMVMRTDPAVCTVCLQESVNVIESAPRSSTIQRKYIGIDGKQITISNLTLMQFQLVFDSLPGAVTVANIDW